MFMRAIQFQNKRVGSTFLQKAIDSHPDIQGIDEVFVNFIKQGIRKSNFVPFVSSDINDSGEYIEEVINKTYFDHNTIFKLMYNQIDYHKGLTKYIYDNQIPIILLKRKNLLKQVVSFFKMGEYDHRPISLSPLEIYDAVKEADRLNTYWENSNVHGLNIKLALYYEDIITDRVFKGYTLMSSEACHVICDFFNVKYVQLISPTKKKNKENLSVYLPNIEDIKKKFKNTKYEWMVEND